MNVKERIQLLKIIEKMEEYPEYSKKVGLKDISIQKNWKREEEI